MTRTLEYKGVTSEEMDRLRTGIRIKYPQAPDLTTNQGGPISVGHGYNIFWTLAGTVLLLTIDGPMLWMQVAADRLIDLVKTCIGRVPE